MRTSGARGVGSSIRWIFAALLGLPLLAFLPVFSADFLTWDDYENVAKNPAMLSTSSDAANGWTNINKPAGELYIPLTYTVWSILASMARLDMPDPDGIQLSATTFHAANLFLHLGSAVLVYLILRRLIRRDWPAVIGALLFALHPVQVESVAWVTGMKDVLSGFLSLGAIYAFLRFVQLVLEAPLGKKAAAKTAGPSARWAWYGAGLFLFMLSTVAKPSSVIVPVLVVIVALAAVLAQSPSAEGSRSASTSRPNGFARLVPFIPWLAPLVFFSLLIVLETRHVQPAIRIVHAPLSIRPFIAGDSLAFYVRQLFLPIHLVPDYGRTPDMVAHGASFYWIWVVPVILVIMGALAWKRNPWILVGTIIFFAAPLPVLGLFPFNFQLYSTVADHYLYVAMLGPALLAAAMVSRFWNSTTIAVASVLLVVLGIATFAQAMRWHDTVRLFTYTLRINPRSFVSHGQLGYLAAADKNDEEAAGHYAAAVQIRPHDFFSNYNWGNLLFRQKNYLAAIDHYKIAIEAMPENAQAHNNYGYALIKLNRTADAIKEFKKSAAADPNYADPQKNLGLAMLMQGNNAEAYEYFQRTLALDPNNETARKAIQKLDAQRRFGPLPKP